MTMENLEFLGSLLKKWGVSEISGTLLGSLLYGNPTIWGSEKKGEGLGFRV